MQSGVFFCRHLTVGIVCHSCNVNLFSDIRSFKRPVCSVYSTTLTFRRTRNSRRQVLDSCTGMSFDSLVVGSFPVIIATPDSICASINTQSDP